MDATRTLHQQIGDAHMLLSLYADILGDDAQAKHDAVEGETSLHEAMHMALARVIEAETMAASLKAAEARLYARRKMLEGQSENLRTAMALAMEVGEMQRYECDLGTASITKTPQTLITTDEAVIPVEYWERQDPKLDRRALLAAVKEAARAGRNIPGATLSEPGTTLTIR